MIICLLLWDDYYRWGGEGETMGFIYDMIQENESRSEKNLNICSCYPIYVLYDHEKG